MLQSRQQLLENGISHLQSGRLADSAQLFQNLLATQPNDAEALHWLGIIAKQQGDSQQAITLIRQALAFKADYAEAYYNLGFILQETGDVSEAMSCFKKTISYKPDFAEAYCSLGMVLKSQGLYQEAINRFRQAITFKLNLADAHNNLGNTLRLVGELDEAVAAFNNALAIKPNAADVLNNLGVTLQQQSKFKLAIEKLQRSIELKPDSAEVYCNLGSCYQSMSLYDKAIEIFEHAVKLRPDMAHAHNYLGMAYGKKGKLVDALNCFNQTILLDPNMIEAHYNIHDVQLNCCIWDNYPQHVALMHESITQKMKRFSPFLFLAISQSPADEKNCAQTYCNELFPPADFPIWNGEKYAHDKIRVAYISADFHNHATAFLMAGLFEKHDRNRFEITAISLGPDSNGDMRQRLLPAFDHFVDVKNLNDKQIALILRQREIDIAVDLKGYTHESRPNIFAQRPAPIQVSYLGYPGTLGASYIDYIVADETVIHADEEPYYLEKVVYMPDTYQVNDDKRAIAGEKPTKTAAGLPERGFVFCCFNNNYKLTPAVFDVWMRLLQQVPDSVLWLLQSNPYTAVNLRKEAEKRGIAAHRLVFAPIIKLELHLARAGLADLFLDTQPYNAHTTASDALWAGVPVLTCTGNTFASRVAASLLTAIDLPELITDNLLDYEQLALKLATQPEFIQTIRQKLAQHRLEKPLFNTDLFRQNLESAYTSMWKRQQAGLEPVSFKVLANGLD